MATDGLTDRQMQIARMVAFGLDTKEIAYQLGLSYSTVRNYQTDIYKTVAVQSSRSLMLVAIKRGWVDLDELLAAAEARAQRLAQINREDCI